MTSPDTPTRGPKHADKLRDVVNDVVDSDFTFLLDMGGSQDPLDMSGNSQIGGGDRESDAASSRGASPVGSRPASSSGIRHGQARSRRGSVAPPPQPGSSAGPQSPQLPEAMSAASIQALLNEAKLESFDNWSFKLSDWGATLESDLDSKLFTSESMAMQRSRRARRGRIRTAVGASDGLGCDDDDVAADGVPRLMDALTEGVGQANYGSSVGIQGAGVDMYGSSLGVGAAGRPPLNGGLSTTSGSGGKLGSSLRLDTPFRMGGSTRPSTATRGLDTATTPLRQSTVSATPRRSVGLEGLIDLTHQYMDMLNVSYAPTSRRSSLTGRSTPSTSRHPSTSGLNVLDTNTDLGRLSGISARNSSSRRGDQDDDVEQDVGYKYPVFVEPDYPIPLQTFRDQEMALFEESIAKRWQLQEDCIEVETLHSELELHKAHEKQCEKAVADLLTESLALGNHLKNIGMATQKEMDYLLSLDECYRKQQPVTVMMHQQMQVRGQASIALPLH
ncbi:hypothetical protein BC831DRAFT_474874 [Entophlyctis helioformis]|nr:hypothetical protein BC831DRAFT_474874 [Entophlyctis helioformis]